VIVVKYNTKKVGRINKSIRVYSNAKQSVVTLKVKGQVIKTEANTLPGKNLQSSGAPVKK